jgi:hypothetical protein
VTDLAVADIRAYLAAQGWSRRPETWRGASIWVRDGAPDVLLPARDGMGDSTARIDDVLAALAAAERRDPDQVARDIGGSHVDVQVYRLPGAVGSLDDAVTALTAVQTILRSAARTVVEGPRPFFSGGAPKPVRDLLAGTEVVPAGAGGRTLTARVPLGPDGPGGPFGRRVMRQLHEAFTAISRATATVRPALEQIARADAVRTGVSADLCGGLSDLARLHDGAPLEVGFRWAPALPEEAAGTVGFAPGSGAVLRAASRRLRQGAGLPVVVTGTVETLNDSDSGADRWRVKVRGDIAGGSGRRTVWVRLPDGAAYERAIGWHRHRTPIRASGALSTVSGRVELTPDRIGPVPGPGWEHDEGEDL